MFGKGRAVRKKHMEGDWLNPVSVTFKATYHIFFAAL